MNRPKRAALGMLLAACVSDVTVARGNVFVGSVLYPLNVPTGVQNLSDFNALTSGGIGAGDGTTSAGNLNALEWSATGAVTNLNPTSAGITYSSAQGACGSQQVGYGYGATATFGLYQAYLWTGSAASAVNLNPYQLDDLASAAYATDGSTQVGYGETGTNVVGAVLWTGSAISAVSLNPTGLGFTQSTAYGVGGGEEVGVAGSSNIAANAVLWKGTAASAINLNPSQLDITQSTAMNTDGILQVGYGSGPNTGVDNNGNPLTHALLWDGSAATAVDLNPGSLNVFESVATAVGGGVEAGYGYLTSGYGNALAWTGTAASAVDLQTVLPTSGTWTDSYALNVSSSGNVFGNAYGTYGGVTGQFAVEWLSVPALTWNNAGGTGDGVTWDAGISQNWNNGTGPAVYSNGSIVTFNDDNNGNYTVVLATTVSPYSVAFLNESGNYSISGPGGITGTSSLSVLGGGAVILSTSNSYTGGTNIVSGKLVIDGPGALPAREPVSIGTTSYIPGTQDPAFAGTLQLATVKTNFAVSSLTIDPGSMLDLESNSLTIDYGATDPMATILSYLTDGFKAGWAGGEISSSTVAHENASQKALVYNVGYADGADTFSGVPAGEIEILPTLDGDAKLQGNVVFGDFQLLAQYFGKPGTSWDEGDFTYSGSTSFGDFQLLAQNFGATNSGLTAGELASIDQFAAIGGEQFVPDAGGGYSLVAVPEPAAALLLLPTALAASARRRRVRHGN